MLSASNKKIQKQLQTIYGNNHTLFFQNKDAIKATVKYYPKIKYNMCRSIKIELQRKKKIWEEWNGAVRKQKR